MGDPWMAPPENPSTSMMAGASASFARPAARKFTMICLRVEKIGALDVTAKEAMASNKLMAHEKRWRAFASHRNSSPPRKTDSILRRCDCQISAAPRLAIREDRNSHADAYFLLPSALSRGGAPFSSWARAIGSFGLTANAAGCAFGQETRLRELNAPHLEDVNLWKIRHRK